MEMKLTNVCVLVSDPQGSWVEILALSFTILILNKIKLLKFFVPQFPCL